MVRPFYFVYNSLVFPQKNYQIVPQLHWQFLKNLHTELMYNPAILLQGTYPEDLEAGTWTGICTPIFIAARFTVARGGSNPVSINEWMGKHNVVYTHWNITQPKNSGNSDSGYNMGQPCGHYAKWNKTVTERQTLNDYTYRRYLQKSNSEKEEHSQGLGGKGEWEVSV